MIGVTEAERETARSALEAELFAKQIDAEFGREARYDAGLRPTPDPKKQTGRSTSLQSVRQLVGRHGAEREQTEAGGVTSIKCVRIGAAMGARCPDPGEKSDRVL